MRRPARSAAAGHAVALGAGTVIAGLAAYGYIALGTRGFGAREFAPVAVIWSFWPIAAAAFGLPLEQWTARELLAGPEGDARVRAGLRTALPAIATLCLLAGAVAWAAGPSLFGSRTLVFPLVLVAVSLGAASMGLLRGGLAGRGRYLASATATSLENLVRLAAAGAVLALGGELRAYAAVLVIGPLVGLLWPSAFVFRADPVPPDGRGRGLFEYAGASLLAQLVLGAPPLVLAAISGPTAAVTATLAALALMRAPYLVAVGVSVRALPGLSRALARRERAAARWLAQVVVSTVALAAVAAVLAPLVMPP